MQGPNSILEKTFIADGAVAAYRIVNKGANEDDAAQSASASGAGYGISQHDAADNEVVRVMMIGISKVVFGGTVTQGDLLVADANGKAVAATRHTHTENTGASYTQNAATGVGTGQRSIGIAMCDGVAGDVGTVLLNPSFV